MVTNSSHVMGAQAFAFREYFGANTCFKGSRMSIHSFMVYTGAFDIEIRFLMQ
jgi:hypothetical protein